MAAMKILNFGSLNLDYVYRVAHSVQPGETIASSGMETFCGGKGLNQSVALARAGAEVYHAGRVGEDGQLLIETCRQSGVHTELILQTNGKSGHTIIQVDDNGQNSILLAGGANRRITEQDVETALTLAAVEAKFGGLLPRMKWLNFGGGHHITRPGYRLATLEQCITETQKKYGVQVYLEPGEAWALNAGYLVTTVLDTLQNGETSLAILDMSAACHTPDVIEMPYRPPLLDAGDPGEKPYLIRLGGPTCLAGDVVGDYSFASPLTEGQRLIFGDMAIYTTCKNNTFNGMPLPPIWAMDENGTCRELVKFGYSDFKMRLGRAAD